jgi:threonine dehydrogenase-like Zn-dependent dehydrogenase
LEQVPDPVAAVLSVTGGRGADVVYDAGGRAVTGKILLRA